jgi:outer membrane protein TolC
VRSAKASELAVHRSVAIATARSYLSVLTARRLLALSIQARETARAHYEYAHLRVSGGLGNRLNELRALDELRSNEAAVASAETAVLRAREALGDLAGQEEALDVADEVELGVLPEQDLVSDASLHERADLVALKRRREAAAAVLADSWQEYLPYVSGSLSAAVQNPETTTTPALGWQAQFVLALPVYDGGLRLGAKRERRELLEQADLASERALREARAEVRVAFSALRDTEQTLLSARESAAAAKDALTLATLAFHGGAISNLEVIDAERRHRDTDIKVAIAEDSVRQARLEVLAAAGKFPPE